MLREALKAALPAEVNIIDNDYHGTYSLTPQRRHPGTATRTSSTRSAIEISDLVDRLAT